MAAKDTHKKGYIGLYRKIQDNFLWQESREFSKAEAWIDILMEVRYSKTPEKVLIGSTILTCGYGESLKSIETWAKRWNWTRSKVWRFFTLLESESMIVRKPTQLTTHLKVCNYGAYDPKRNSKRNANETQMDTEEESKEGKENPNSDELRLASLLFTEIRNRKPNFRKPDLQKWAIHIDRLIRLDKRTPEQIEAVIRWCQADSGGGSWAGWQNNILSTEKLREQIDKLELAMEEESPQRTSTPIERGPDGRTPRERAMAQLENENAK